MGCTASHPIQDVLTVTPKRAPLPPVQVQPARAGTRSAAPTGAWATTPGTADGNSSSAFDSIDETHPYNTTVERVSPRLDILQTRRTIRRNTVQVELLKCIFDEFDRKRDGHIDLGELIATHEALCEPVNRAEAVAGLKLMGAKASERADFKGFSTFWDHSDALAAAADTVHARRYATKFNFLRAKVSHPTLANIRVKTSGEPDTMEYRFNFYSEDPNSGELTQISPWHDIPYKNPDGTYNMIVEIPKWSRKKYEIATKEQFNSIKQDTKKGKLRSYKWGDMMFNYGAFPQTWEDPKHVTPGTGAKGDDDPIDVVELGHRSWKTGSVVQVKVLGVLAMIDDGETDWKVLAINIADPLAAKLNDVDDLEHEMPGCVHAIREWLRLYKSPDINEFGFNGEAKDAAFTKEVISETHQFWRELKWKEQAEQAVVPM